MLEVKCLAQIEQASEKRRMMTGGYEQVGLHIAGQPRDLFRWLSNEKDRLASHVCLLDLAGEFVEHSL